MSLNSRAVRMMVTELSIPAATVEDTRIQLPSGTVSGFRVRAPQIGYDRVWFTEQRQWISDDPRSPGSGELTVKWPGLYANANPYTVGVAVIAELWDLSRARLFNDPGEYEAFFAMCARSCEVFLTTSVHQSLGGPGAAEPIQYANMIVVVRNSDAAGHLEREIFQGGRHAPIREYGPAYTAAAALPRHPSPPAYTGLPAPKKMSPLGIVAISVGAAVGIGLVGTIAAFAVSGAISTNQAAQQGSEPTGRWLDAEIVDSDEPNWQCIDGDDCWTWQVIPAEDCAAVDITFGFASTSSGASVATETRRVHNWYAGQTTDVVLNIDPQPYEYAGIDEIWCER